MHHSILNRDVAADDPRDDHAARVCPVAHDRIRPHHDGVLAVVVEDERVVAVASAGQLKIRIRILQYRRIIVYAAIDWIV